MEQVRAGVIAPDRVAPLAIDHRAHMIADGQRLLKQRLVGTHSLHRQHAP